jgi:N-methylhydantoinase A
MCANVSVLDVQMFKVCIDTGGTFTDCVVLDGQNKLHEFKSPTTPWDFSEGVLNTIVDAAAHFGNSLADFLKQTEWIVHGTSVSTNALVQRKLARTALITSRGFRDIIEMRRSLKIETKSMYDAYIPPYEPIIPRYLRFTVAEKTKASGEIITPVDEAELLEVVGKIKKHDIEAVAICFINSYSNMDNELKAGEICQKALPGVFVSCSSVLLPKMGEYERESTCVINASVGPIVDKYLTMLEAKLREAGFENQLLIVQANQFVQSVGAIVAKPVYLTGSGPAAGPAGAAYLGASIGEDNFLIGDMGGTTWDASLVKDRQVSLKVGDWLGDDRLGIKVADVVSIGAGGGSIGWIDSLGLLQVGPQSASANPGPACYGQGGTEPTVTDAAVILGYINTDNFNGGKLRLQVDPAKQAMSKIAGTLNMSIEEAAQAMFNTVNHNMADAISEISTRKGYDVRDFNLLAIGGGGPLCGAFVGNILGMKKTIVPRYSSSFCAWSMFFLDIGRDYVRSYFTKSDRVDLGTINKLFADMAAEALKDVEAFNVTLADMVFEKSVEMRYQGQYHVLEVKLPVHEITDTDLRDVEERFHALHEELFTFSLRWVPMEMINVRLTAKIKSTKLPIAKVPMSSADPAKALVRMNDCYFDAVCSATPVYDGLKLEAGNVIRGSAIIQEPTATTVIPANTVCKVDAYGNYIITPAE